MSPEEIYDLIAYTVETPTFLGPLHRTGLLFTLVSCILLPQLLKNAKEKNFQNMSFRGLDYNFGLADLSPSGPLALPCGRSA